MRTFILCCLALVACVAACDAPDRTTAPVPDVRPTLDLAVGPTQPPGYPGYVLTDISRGLSSRATAINDSGVIVGSFVTGGSQHAFLRRADGTFHDIPPLSGDVSNVANGVDLAGDVVGTSVGADSSPHAWLRRHGQAVQRLRATSCHGATRADAVDTTGIVVGSCDGHPAEWIFFDAGPITMSSAHGEALATVKPTAAVSAMSVGYVVSDVDTSAVVWHPWPVVLAMPSGTTAAVVTDVNTGQEAVGRFTQHGAQQGFVSWPTSGMVLPHPAYGVSNRGRIVGWYVSLPSAAYTIAPDGISPGGTTVETQLPPTTANRVAVGVNRCGAIVGHYFPSGLQGGPRAALWSKRTCD